MRNGFVAPFVDRLQYNFGIAIGAKSSAVRLERLAQRAEVVDLAVVHQRVPPVGCGHWLPAGFDIDHGEAAMAEMRDSLLVIAFGIRPAMREAAIHASQDLVRIRRDTRDINKTAYAAHCLAPD